MARAYDDLKYRPTSYEVAIVKAGQVVRVIGYTVRKTKASLLRFARDNGAEIAALMTEAELEMDWRYSASLGSVAFGSVSVAFTGATEVQKALAA